MAIVQNLWLKKSKKKLGGVVLYQAMEQTRARELATSVSNPRTPTQMQQRVKWANLVNFYRVNKGWMKYAFETKTAQQSEYNKFMSVNVASSAIYFTKQLAGMGACVVFPYIITQGSLTPIEFSPGTGMWLSNIFVPDDFTLTAGTSVGDLANAILPYNPAIKAGDQLSFIRLTQMTNADTGAPYVIVRKYEVLMDRSSTALLSDFLPLEYFTITTQGDNYVLAVVNSGNAGGFALVLSRTTGGKTFVSTQRVIVANNAAVIAAWSSQAALDAAVQSYGEGDDAFLSSNTAAGVQSIPVALSITALDKGGSTLVPGQTYLINQFAAGDIINVFFNAAVTGTTITGSIKANEGNAISCTAVVDSGHIKLTLPNPYTPGAGQYLERIQVSIDGDIYSAVFAVPGGGDDPGDDQD